MFVNSGENHSHDQKSQSLVVPRQRKNEISRLRQVDGILDLQVQKWKSLKNDPLLIKVYTLKNTLLPFRQ